MIRLLAFFLLVLLPVTALHAQVGTAFSYQGRLYDGGLPASGEYALRVTPFDAAEAGSMLAAAVTLDPVSVVDGVFTVELDFGPAVFLGAPVWLQIEVDGPGTDFVVLAPRQPVQPTPYAMHAGGVDVDSIDSFALQDGAVTAAKLAPASVGSAQIDASQVQRRIGPACAAGQAIAEVAQDGAATCVATGDDDWFNGTTANTTDKRVAIGSFGFTGAQLFVLKDSTVSAPQVQLSERGQDYARLTMQTVGPAGEEHFNFWTIAARTEPDSLGGPDTDRINFFNNRNGDVMSLTGNGRLGIGVFSPAAELDVDGAVRVRGLAHADSGTRSVRVEPDGDLVASAPVTRYLTLGPYDFDTNRDSIVFHRVAGMMYLTDSSGDAGLGAHVHLPDGAVITGMKIWYFDSSSEDVTYFLWRAPIATATAFTLATFTSSGSEAAVRTVELPVSNHVVDNSDNGYMVIVTAPTWPGSLIRLHEVRIDYIVP